MNPEDSKEYSWKWVTADELLSTRPCEICSLMLTCDNKACSATIYSGENDKGDTIVFLKSLENRTQPMTIHHHVYCRRGLFIKFGEGCKGIFIQWLERPQGVGYPIK